MPGIDDRVVEMRFENKDFEKGIDTSISSIDRLKSALNFKDAAKGFDELDSAAKKGLDLSKIEAAAEAITKKFSFMGTVWDQTVRNMTNKAIELGNTITKSVTNTVKSMTMLEQIPEGFTKYEQKTSSVQTLVNSTGKSMEEINGYLDRLMQYSDETSFGFTDMTSALQTMVTAGGELDNLIPMLMGIGNATAFAGKGASEFSRVVYNLNQSYGMGYLSTSDWRSVELAGAASKQLKEQILASAAAVGDMKVGQYTMETFSEALTDKVFTKKTMEHAFKTFAEVTLEAEKLVAEGMLDTFSEAYDYLADSYDDFRMKAATAAQEAKTFGEAVEATKDAVSSGWMKSFELIIGNYEEAKELWTWLANELWDMFAASADERNEMLQMWHDCTDGVSGYALAIEGLHNIWEGLEGLVARGKDIFHSIIPPMTYERLMNITEAFHRFSERFRDTFAIVEDTVEELISPITENDELQKTVEVVETVLTTVGRTRQVLDQLTRETIAGKYGNGGERRRAIEALGYSYELVQNAVNAALGSSFRYAITEADTVEVVKESTAALDENADALEENSEDVNRMLTPFERLQGICKGITAAIDAVVQTGKALWKVVLQPVVKWAKENILDRILDKLAALGLKIDEIVTKWRGNDTIETKLQNFADKFTAAKTKVDEFWKKLKELPSVTKFKAYIDQFKEWLGTKTNSAWSKLVEFFSGDKMKLSLPSMDDVLAVVDKIVDKFNKLFELIEGGWPKVEEFFKGLDFSGAGTDMKSISDAVVNLIKSLASNEEVKEGTKNLGLTIWNGVTGVLEGLDPLGGITKFFTAIQGLWGTVTGTKTEPCRGEHHERISGAADHAGVDRSERRGVLAAVSHDL